jgi:hypothetical protein
MEQFLDPAARFVPDHDCGNLRGHARARGETDEGVHGVFSSVESRKRSRRAAEVAVAKRGKVISFQDASIAAVCIAYGCTFVTENDKLCPGIRSGSRANSDLT